MQKHLKNSIRLTQICVALFAAILLACDIAGAENLYTFLSGSINLPEEAGRTPLWAWVELYALSVPAWVLLYEMFRLLARLAAGSIFTGENVCRLRAVSLCCGAAALLSLGGCFFFAPLLVVAVAAAFMMLLVRIIQNAFQNAAAMKDELDLTV